GTFTKVFGGRAGPPDGIEIEGLSNSCASKDNTRCGLPSSETRKSRAESPCTGLPSPPRTTTSTITRRTVFFRTKTSDRQPHSACRKFLAQPEDVRRRAQVL